MAHGDLAPQTGLCSADLGRCTRFQGFTSAKRALRMHRIKLVTTDPKILRPQPSGGEPLGPGTRAENLGL